MIKTVELTKVFRTDEVETTALNKVNMEISKGEFVAIMGPSGCGKSTLLNIIGLLDNPSGGKLYFLDKEISNFSERNRTNLRKSNIGFVFQSFNLIDELNVFENVELPLLYQKVSAIGTEKKGGRSPRQDEDLPPEKTFSPAIVRRTAAKGRHCQGRRFEASSDPCR